MRERIGMLFNNPWVQTTLLAIAAVTLVKFGIDVKDDVTRRMNRTPAPAPAPPPATQG